MNLVTTNLLKTGLITLCLLWGTQAQANLLTFNLDYSGQDFGNSAQAHGSITIDDQLIGNPSIDPSFLYLGDGQAITALTLTVSNAAAGNGTFQLTDFVSASWSTAGATLDLTRQLLGQTTAGGGWGSTYDGSSGDFNFQAADSSFAPTLAGAFTLAANNDVIGGNLMKLTSVQPVPLPASIWLFASALAGIGFGRSRKVNS